MAENTTLARPYARAAFEVAKANDQLDQWMNTLTTAAQVSISPKVRAMLSSPSIAATEKGATIARLLGGKLDPFIDNLFVVLAKYNRLQLLPEIATLFLAMKTHHEKLVEVEVVSAFPVNKTLHNKLLKALKQKLERDVKLTSRVDESLLGGAVIRAGDTVIDGSVKGRLSKLADALNA